MVRHRHVKKSQSFPESKNARISQTHEDETEDVSMVGQVLWIGFGLFVICVVGYLVHLGSLDLPVNAPFDAPKVSPNLQKNASRFWGSYRPGVYFGLRTRAPKDLLVGLMWMSPKESLRHWCEQSDDLESFGWLQHDGENFGYQELIDKSVILKTSFVKKGERWTAKIKAESKHSSPQKQITSLFFYAGLESGSTLTEKLKYDKSHNIIYGSTSHLGNFKMSFHEKGKGIIGIYNAALETPGPHKYSEVVMRSLKLKDGMIALERPTAEHPDLAVYQIVAKFPFELEVVFSPLDNVSNQEDLKGDAYDQLLAHWRGKFEDKFEDTFHLKSKDFDEKTIKFAQAAMSNMIGGIGYFYGHSLVQSEKSNGPVNYWDAPLLTAVPSRSFFPRGFLWDEGFHNLLISKWNPKISMDILGHWMDLLNNEGWIPREQILGLEARAKVPDEFVVQRNRNANPPTLLLSLDSMIKDKGMEIPQEFKNYLKKMWPRLEKWYGWFHRTQMGEIPGTYRWRGRNASAIYELNPKTLTSGLDDFPRASHPSNEERHIDLRCWMALASSLMSNIGEIIGIDSKELELYTSTAKTLLDNDLLDQAHWSEQFGAYLDYGLHTEQVSLKRPPRKHSNHHLHEAPPQKIRVVGKEPKFQFVNQVGYVSLFPFILKIVSPDSSRLEKILSDLDNPKVYYTDYGLRSLSKSSSLYNKRNTEHDPPYWRGPIWININYLSVRALHYYAYLVPGPYAKEAQRIYLKLRSNLISNLMKEYYRTGYIWEQYDDSTGAGQGCRPFTGWSSLIVLIMGENY
uniref:Mannosyl-oligosaccharide glucosidase n=1 Tax=Lepeophtheirus salmonis TaxID=72036 RepID=A0A0K2TMD1_LEPSM